MWECYLFINTVKAILLLTLYKLPYVDSIVDCFHVNGFNIIYFRFQD